LGIRRTVEFFEPREEKVLVRAIVLRGVGSVSTKWYQSGYIFSFCSREEDPSCRPEEKGNRLIPKTGMREEEVGRQEIQRWKGK
jgi:hypothetical protein